MIRNARPDDAAGIAEIYAHYVLHDTATFEEEVPSVAEMAGRIAEVQADYPWLVYDDEGIRGYAYAARWKARSAYRYSVESSVYVAPELHEQGLGFALYSALLHELEDLGLHAVIGGITLPNPASVRLHEKLGFEAAGVLPEVGYKFDRLVSVGYWVKRLGVAT